MQEYTCQNALALAMLKRTFFLPPLLHCLGGFKFLYICSIAFLPLRYTLPLPLELSRLDGNRRITSLIITTIMHSFALSWVEKVCDKKTKQKRPPPPPKELNGSSRQELDKQKSLQQWKTHCCTLPCSTFPHAVEPCKCVLCFFDPGTAITGFPFLPRNLHAAAGATSFEELFWTAILFSEPETFMVKI